MRSAITLDMGGTTAKASIIENGALPYSPQYEVGASLSSGSRLVGGGGELIRAPTIDIAEVGAGGGSVAWLDAARGLRVGPKSAGAVPGPACYGRGGTEPTLTDANAVLGLIRPGPLADGQVRVDPEKARRAVHDRIAAPMGLDLLRAADGVHRIADAVTMRALRQVSTERGRDPRDFALIAFGGCGPVHAAALATELGIDRVVVPPLPGLFSALGLLFSDMEHHGVASCPLGLEPVDAGQLEALRAGLEERLLRRFESEGYPREQVRLDCGVDARFRGQTSEVRVPMAGARFDAASLERVTEDFLREHEGLYGHRSAPGTPVEFVAIRLVGRVEVPHPQGRIDPAPAAGGAVASRRAYFGPEWGAIDTPVVARVALDGASGPLLIDEYDSTVVVPPGHTARVDEQMNIHIERRCA